MIMEVVLQIVYFSFTSLLGSTEPESKLLKGGLYRGLYGGLLYGLIKGDTRSLAQLKLVFGAWRLGFRVLGFRFEGFRVLGE